MEKAPFYLLTLGIMFIAVFLFIKFWLSPTDFSLRYRTNTSIAYFQISALLFVVLYAVLTFLLENISQAPDKARISLTLVVFLSMGFVAIMTHPLRSQDLYWSLLFGKGFSHFGFNPYTTTTRDLSFDAWSQAITHWQDKPTHYGPIWMLLMGLLTRFTSSLAIALLVSKTFSLFVLILCGVVFWKILALHGYSLKEQYVLTTLLAWNPFVIQHALIDFHNDTLMMLAISVSYLLFAQKKYELSALSLVLGGFVKYACWLVVPVPLFYLVHRKSLRQSFVSMFVIAATGVFVAALLYAPFRLSRAVFTGAFSWYSEVGWTFFYWPGTAFLSYAFQFHPAEIRLLGLGLGLVSLVICLTKNKPLAGFVVPYLVIWFFGTPWFQAWYVLWVFPLLALWLPRYLFLTLSLLLFLLPDPTIIPRETLWFVFFAFLMVFPGYHLMKSSKQRVT